MTCAIVDRARYFNHRYARLAALLSRGPHSTEPGIGYALATLYQQGVSSRLTWLAMPACHSAIFTSCRAMAA
jgi:hypothetical protein